MTMHAGSMRWWGHASGHVSMHACVSECGRVYMWAGVCMCGMREVVWACCMHACTGGMRVWTWAGKLAWVLDNWAWARQSLTMCAQVVQGTGMCKVGEGVDEVG